MYKIKNSKLAFLLLVDTKIILPVNYQMLGGIIYEKKSLKSSRKSDFKESFQYGAREGTRTPTDEPPDPKSGASASFATRAFELL